MKAAVRRMLDAPTPQVDRRSFFKTLGLGAAGAMALTGDAAAEAAANLVQANVKRASSHRRSRSPTCGSPSSLERR